MVTMFFTVSVVNNYALNLNIAMPLHMIFRSVSTARALSALPEAPGGRRWEGLLTGSVQGVRAGLVDAGCVSRGWLSPPERGKCERGGYWDSPEVSWVMSKRKVKILPRNRFCL